MIRPHRRSGLSNKLIEHHTPPPRNKRRVIGTGRTGFLWKRCARSWTGHRVDRRLHRTRRLPSVVRDPLLRNFLRSACNIYPESVPILPRSGIGMSRAESRPDPPGRASSVGRAAGQFACPTLRAGPSASPGEGGGAEWELYEDRRTPLYCVGGREKDAVAISYIPRPWMGWV